MTEEESLSGGLPSYGFEQTNWNIYEPNVKFSDIKGTSPGVIYHKPVDRYFYANSAGKQELPVGDTVTVSTVADIDVFDVKGDSFQFITVDREDDTVAAHFQDGGTIWDEAIENIAAFDIAGDELVVVGTDKNELIGLDIEFNGIREFHRDLPLDAGITGVEASDSHILITSEQSAMSIDVASREINFSHSFDTEIKSSGVVGELAVFVTANRLFGISQSGDVIVDESVSPDRIGSAPSFSHFTAGSKFGIITNAGHCEILQTKFEGKIIQTGVSETVLNVLNDKINIFSRPDQDQQITTEFQTDGSDPTLKISNHSNEDLGGKILVRFHNAVISELDLDKIEINGLVPGETRTLPIQDIGDGASVEIEYQDEIIEQLSLNLPPESTSDLGSTQGDTDTEAAYAADKPTADDSTPTETDSVESSESSLGDVSTSPSSEPPDTKELQEPKRDSDVIEESSDSGTKEPSQEASSLKSDSTTDTGRESTFHSKLNEQDDTEADNSSSDSAARTSSSENESEASIDGSSDIESLLSSDTVEVSTSETHVGYKIQVSNTERDALPGSVDFKLIESGDELKITVVVDGENIDGFSISKPLEEDPADDLQEESDSQKNISAATDSHFNSNQNETQQRTSQTITTRGRPPRQESQSESTDQNSTSKADDSAQEVSTAESTDDSAQSASPNTEAVSKTAANKHHQRRSTTTNRVSAPASPVRRLRKIGWNWNKAKPPEPTESQAGDIRLNQREVLLDEIKIPVDNSINEIEVLDHWPNESSITIDPNSSYWQQHDNIRCVSSISFNYNTDCWFEPGQRRVLVNGQEVTADHHDQYGNIIMNTLDRNQGAPKIYIQPVTDGSGFELVINAESGNGIIKNFTKSEYSQTGYGTISANEGYVQDIRFSNSGLKMPNSENILAKMGEKNGIHYEFLLSSFAKTNRSPKHINSVIPVFKNPVTPHISIPEVVTDGLNSYENILRTDHI